MKKQYAILVAIFLLLAGPFSGALIRGLPEGFFNYPPLLEETVEPPPFSGPVYLLFCVIFGLAMSCYCWPENFGFKRKRKASPTREEEAEEPPSEPPRRHLPAWGTTGALLLAGSWCLAWGRFGALGSLNDFWFLPLWLGYIFLADGLVFKRQGRSLWNNNRRGFWWFFPLSAALWWYFEYLNRFVMNWSYQGMEGFGVLRYILFASLCFSTVLPAVFETAHLILSFAYIREAFADGPPLRKQNEVFAFSFICLGLVGLFLVGLFPNSFFWLLWLAPAAIAGGMMGLGRMRLPFAALQKGHYALPAALCLAGLVCGFFWELWNLYSQPKWVYHIPYVTRFPVFEMPLPGYAGYLPFALVCWIGWLMLLHLLPEKWAHPSWQIEEELEQAARGESARRN